MGGAATVGGGRGYRRPADIYASICDRVWEKGTFRAKCTFAIIGTEFYGVPFVSKP